MAFQEGVSFRNSGLTGKNTNLGATATLKIFSGAEPANCAASDPSGLLVTINLPNPPFASASGGAITLTGTWSATAAASGTAASFRVYDSSSNCAMQGNTTSDMTLSSTGINMGQTVTVNTFTVTAGNS